MRPSFTNILLLLGVLGAEYWVLSGHFGDGIGAESFVALIASIAALIQGENLLQKRGWLPTHSTHDADLHRQLLQVLPPESTTSFLKHQDFADSFNPDSLAGINKFIYEWSTVSTEFIDQRLQTLKENLFGSLDRFTTEISKRTSPIGNGQRSSVLSDAVRAQGGARPEWVVQDARILNKAAADSLRHYETLLRALQVRLSK